MAVQEAARQRRRRRDPSRSPSSRQRPARISRRPDGPEVPAEPAVDEGRDQPPSAGVARVGLAASSKPVKASASSPAGPTAARRRPAPRRRRWRGPPPGSAAPAGSSGLMRWLSGRRRASGAEIAEHAAGLDRRQLIGVADEDQARLRPQRARQLLDQREVEHRRLVDDHPGVGQRVVLVVTEGAAAQRAVRREAEQPVQRRRALGREMPSAASPSATRFAALPVGAATAIDSGRHPQRAPGADDAADERRLAAARAAGHDGRATARARPRSPRAGRRSSGARRRPAAASAAAGAVGGPREPRGRARPPDAARAGESRSW